MRQLRRRFWVEMAALLLSVVTLALTILAKHWIEVAFGVDPDHGSGFLEWLIVCGSIALTVTSSSLAQSELRMMHGRAAEGS